MLDFLTAAAFAAARESPPAPPAGRVVTCCRMWVRLRGHGASACWRHEHRRARVRSNRVVTDEDRLSALAPAWDLLSRSHDGTPFTLPSWFECWWGSFGGGRELRVCTAWRGEA